MKSAAEQIIFLSFRSMNREQDTTFSLEKLVGKNFKKKNPSNTKVDTLGILVKEGKIYAV